MIAPKSVFEVPHKIASIFSNAALSYKRYCLSRFLTFVKFLISDPPQPRSSKSNLGHDGFIFPDSPFSHFLLLTADGNLQNFYEKQKVFNSTYYDLFPSSLDNFSIQFWKQLASQLLILLIQMILMKWSLVLVIEIFDGTIPHQLKNATAISNVPALIDTQFLKKLWKCFVQTKYLKVFVQSSCNTGLYFLQKKTSSFQPAAMCCQCIFAWIYQIQTKVYWTRFVL